MSEVRLIDANALLEKAKGVFDDRAVFVDDILNAPTIEPKQWSGFLSARYLTQIEMYS